MEIAVKIVTSNTFWTIISGTLVFAISQYLMLVWIQPLNQYRQLRNKVSVILVKNAPYYFNPLQLSDHPSEEEHQSYQTVADETRIIAAELRGYIEIIPFIHCGIPAKTVIFDASKNLVGLSNSLYKPYNIHSVETEKNNYEMIKEIKIALNIFNSKDNY